MLLSRTRVLCSQTNTCEFDCMLMESLSLFSEHSATEMIDVIDALRRLEHREQNSISLEDVFGLYLLNVENENE